MADVLGALDAAIAAGDPKQLLDENIRFDGGTLRVRSLRLDLSRYRRVLVVGGGKASGKMALELERILGRRITAGVVNIPEYQEFSTKGSLITFNPATHPMPSTKGVRGVRMMLELVGVPSSDDLIICLFSGGGSALLPLPLGGVTIRDKVRVTRLLLRSGADIHEINAVRKHLSLVKGGRLAELLFPATVVSLIISDVVGDRVDSVASGPTAPDPTTFSEAKQVLVDRSVWDKVAPSVRDVMAKGISGRIDETPKPGSRVFRRVHNIVIGSNRISRLSAAQELRRMGYHTTVLRGEVTGEASKAGIRMARMVKDLASQARPWALVGGGETTVTVRGRGRGGRNQEFALSIALAIEGISGIAVGSAATDGVDGPTDAAGAVADGETVARGKGEGLSARLCLERNDSYTFFKRLGDLIMTGPTGTNVNDVFVAIGRPPPPAGRGAR